MVEAMGTPHTWVTVEEASTLTGKTARTIRRWISSGSVVADYRQVRIAAGNSVKTTYVRLDTLPGCEELAKARAAEPQGREHRSLATDVALSGALDEALDLIRCAPESDRPMLVKIAAARHQVSQRTVYRRLKKIEAHPLGLVQPRSDVGRPRIPAEAYGIVVQALATNEPTTPASLIHRTLMRAAPSTMTYEAGGRQRTVSIRTVQRIRQQLLDNPQTALLLSDDDELKEFTRVWAGTVTADHANQLWEMDMTRCDTLVVDESTGKTLRPRVHAVIDIYSGCIPGLAFSREEDQTQTDIALFRSIVRKDGRLGHRWPVWGIPERLYWDNGKTYRSHHARRVLSGLGVEIVHSKPRVSHTRGAIERFFGTLHNFEKSLPGYVGSNAVNRSSETLKRLQRNTERWLETGRDPGLGERLLTLDEYQKYMLAWLVVEYHEWRVDGMTRLEHFASTVPAKSLVEIPIDDLLLHFARREERMVDGAGRIRLENDLWTVPGGALIAFQGRQVLVLRDVIAPQSSRVLVAWKTRTGHLEVIGEAEPAPKVANSIEADADKRAKKAVALEMVRVAKEERKALTDLDLRVTTQIVKELPVTAAPEVQPAARGRLEALNPPSPHEEVPADDALGQWILQLQGRNPNAPTDPEELVRFYGRPAKGESRK